MARFVSRVHLVGIGGIGMSSIAEVLLSLGYAVSGSDICSSELVERLKRLGAIVDHAHRAENVAETDVVVVSSAVKEANVEVVEARRRGIPVVRRAEMLAELMRLKLGIAVAGAHGKTTTTSMIASILEHAQKDPTVVVGGLLNRSGSNALFGAGPYMVVEADESDGSFLHLSPTIAVVTNIDTEHLDFYSGGLEEIREVFHRFVERLPFYGLAVLCLDHPEVQMLLKTLDRRVFTYGLSPQADVRAKHIEVEGSSLRFEVVVRGQSRGIYRLIMHGEHNVLNALAALAVAEELGVAPEQARIGLERFAGVDRRFSIRGEVGGVMVVDDYGHHPTEIRATLEGARKGYPERRLVVIFQPHRFSRTTSLLQEFGRAFHEADEVFVLPIYAAGETPLPDIDHQTVVQAMKSQGHRSAKILSNLKEAAAELMGRLRAGDLLMIFGAGDVGQLAPKLLDELTRGSNKERE
ncbi:MAG: UDP-N-acetylmuramate--L-alanine ligase [Myxococcales bacterium]|nr:UDP-N-acetylmuramate--L-alanine ligase [Myxococcales bacterium]